MDIQFLFVAFGATVLVPLLVGLAPATALFTAGLDGIIPMGSFTLSGIGLSAVAGVFLNLVLPKSKKTSDAPSGNASNGFYHKNAWRLEDCL